MIEGLRENWDEIVTWGLVIIGLGVLIWTKWRETRDYVEIRSGKLSSGVQRDFARLRGLGFDVRLKTSTGGARGLAAHAGANQSTQTLLVKKEQKSRALTELAKTQ